MSDSEDNNHEEIDDILIKKQRETFLGHILGYLALYLSAKNQEKLMSQISRKAGNRRTDERTNGQTTVNL